jgi:hypothetical protein
MVGLPGEEMPNVILQRLEKSEQHANCETDYSDPRALR